MTNYETREPVSKPDIDDMIYGSAEPRPSER